MADSAVQIRMSLDDLKSRSMVYGFGIQKGGEGKSTTTHHVARLLSQCYGVRTLVLDCAQPGTTTMALAGVSGQELPTGLPELFIRTAMAMNDELPGPADLDEEVTLALKGTGERSRLPLQVDQNLYLLPYRPNLARAIRTVDSPDVLLRILRPLLTHFEIVLIDYPPDLTQLMANCLFASDVLITPMKPTAESLEGAEEFFGAIARASQLRERIMGMPTRLGGILFTQVDPRSKQWKDAVRAITAATNVNGLDIKNKLLPFAIKRSTAFPQAYQNGVPVWMKGNAYTPTSSSEAWAGYVYLTEWILRDAGLERKIATKHGAAVLPEKVHVLNPWDISQNEEFVTAGMD